MRSKSRAADILGQIEALTHAPEVVLIICPDHLRQQRIFEMLRQKLFQDVAQPLTLDCAELNRDALLRLRDELSSQSLFSKRQLFALKNAEELDAASGKLLLDTLDGPARHSTLTVMARKLPVSGALYKGLSRKSFLVELPELKGYELKRWVAKEFKAVGVDRIEEAALEILINIGGGEVDRIYPLLEQAALFSEDSSLSVEDLKRLFVEQSEPSEFELVDALQDRNPARAELLLGQLLSSGKNPFALVALLARMFSNYLSIKILAAEGKSSDDIREQMGMTSWVFGRSHGVASRYSLAELKATLAALLRCDSKLKNRSLGTTAVLSELLDALRLPARTEGARGRP
ncbi:MAG: DNA polymerase III subunit delta [Oligoflexia bacterium]|nr:DNA polymerase III subunit delta [Oligoflexia bacterium]